MDQDSSTHPCVEYYKLGLIDEYGKFRILIGNRLLTINCLRCLESLHAQNECRYTCSHFSGPMYHTDWTEEQVGPGATDHKYKVALLCSGRYLRFNKFVNVLDLEESADFEHMTDDEIISALGYDESVKHMDDTDSSQEGDFVPEE